MNLNIRILKKEEIELFNLSEDLAFETQAKYFKDGILPGPREEDNDDYDLNKIIDNPKFTILGIYDNGKFIGGSIVEDMGNNIKEINIFFICVEYQGKGVGKMALEMIENYFKDTKVFRLITPSQVIRNALFYINRCGYNIVEVVDYNKEENTCDFVFEKRR